MTIAAPSILTAAEAREQLRVSRPTLAKYIAKGRFPGAYQLDAHWRIPRADIDAFKASRKPIPNPSNAR